MSFLYLRKIVFWTHPGLWCKAKLNIKTSQSRVEFTFFIFFFSIFWWCNYMRSPMWLVIIADMLFVLVSLQPVFSFFQWMCLRTRIIMIFAQVFSIIFYVACFVAVFFSSSLFFSLHSYGEGRKILFLYFFVFSFDHNSQKTPTHLMMYQYSDSNLEETSSLFSFFREFTFGSFSFTFFVIDVCVILWENIEEIH